MMRMKLNRTLLILACIGVALYMGVNMLAGYQTEEAAPAESPAVTKQQAADAAGQFLQSRYGIGQPRTFVVYQSEKSRSGYLQKEHLLHEYELKYGDRFPLDFYQVSAVDPGSKRKFEVDVNYKSLQIVGWRETLTGTAAAIGRQKADQLAKEEMSRQGFNPDDFSLALEPKKEAGANTYVYEKKAEAIGGSKLRLRIDFDDNALVGYAVQFSIPEDHQAWLDSQDQSASFMTWISMGFTFLMSVAAIVYAVRHRKQMDFRKGLLLTVIFTTIYIVNNINMYPAFKTMSGDIADNGTATLAGSLFMNVVTLLLGLSVYISLASGSRWWESNGWKPWPAWRESRFGSEVFHGMGRGYLLALFILGVQQVLFYAGEVRFDVWAVNDPGDSVLNMLEPKLFPLMAWAAAISEEAAYRLLGILLFKKLFRSNFIAVLLPSIIWAASHTQYPIYPVYTRLIEVTVIGIILGYVFLKYGFITAVFAHACMDSILMGLSLFSLDQAGDAAAGIFYILLPALAALLLAWWHRRRLAPSPG